MNWWGKYVGIPFLDGGRDARGLDCWGLVRFALAQERGIEVPSYGEISALDLARIGRAIAGAVAGPPWVQVPRAAARPFDVLVMYRRRLAVHVALVVTPKLVLHVTERTSTVLLPASSAAVASFPRVECFRHEAAG